MKVNDKTTITAAQMKQMTNCVMHLDVRTKEIHVLKELQAVPIPNEIMSRTIRIQHIVEYKSRF
jgi:hypothetical protein